MIKKLKKRIHVLLMCVIVFSQCCIVYAQKNESTNSFNLSDSGGKCAEKNDIFYYFKSSGNSEMSLYQYNLKTDTESVLCEDSFSEGFATNYEMRVCDDGYIYFLGHRVSDNLNYWAYYRVPVSGGKSEYSDAAANFIFLSDRWAYDMQKNTFYNFATKENIPNTATDAMDLNQIKDYWNMFLTEYDDTIYMAVRATSDITSDNKPKKKIKCLNNANEEYLTNGIYVLPIYEQNAFQKIKENADSFIAYNNNLYIQEGKSIKQYSVQNRTEKTILEKTEGYIAMIAIYNDTLYYSYSVEKNGKHYENIYGVSLNEEQNNTPFVAFPYLIGALAHFSENIVCYARPIHWGLGERYVFNYNTGKKYTAISPCL